jgi:chromosomal replication initiation ATPase DnaA
MNTFILKQQAKRYIEQTMGRPINLMNESDTLVFKSFMEGAKFANDYKEIQVASLEFTVNSIVKIVCQSYEVTLEQLQQANRSAKLVEARKAMSYVLRYFKMLTLQEIGKVLKKDHTSIIYLISSYEAAIQVDDKKRDKINHILSLIKHIEAA